MQQPSVNESHRRGVIKGVGAAGVGLAMLLTVGACTATGGGYLGQPLPGGPVSVYNGTANFGFNFTCQMKGPNKAMISGQLTYHDSAPSSIVLVVGAPPTQFPEIRLHGVVDPFFVNNVSTCQAAADAVPNTALFRGTYQSQDSTLSALHGRFTVQVFDQGEPGRSSGDFTGDSFSIGLQGGAYNGYTRGGYIEGGNVQVSN
jgi:hypothetical protein